MPRFAVYCIADSAVTFAHDDAFTARGLPCATGTVDATVATRQLREAEFTKLIPHGLVVELQGEAPDIRSAIASFGAAANSLGALIGLVANAAVSDFVPHVAINIDPGNDDREFFQQLLSQPPLMPFLPRRVRSDAVRDTIGAVIHNSESARLERAIAHHHLALQNWSPGREIPAAHALWMGLECLTPVARRRHLADLGMSADDLAAEWSVEPRHLDAEVRLRLLCHGDEDAYVAAKKAFAGLEHGFLPIPDVRSASLEHQMRLARYVREAIVSLGDVPAEVQETLLTRPFDRPAHFTVAKYLFGRLVGAPESVRPPDQLYPHLICAPSIAEVPNSNPNEVTIRFDETMKAAIPIGAAIRHAEIEVWGTAVPTERDA